MRIDYALYSVQNVAVTISGFAWRNTSLLRHINMHYDYVDICITLLSSPKAVNIAIFNSHSQMFTLSGFVAVCPI